VRVLWYWHIEVHVDHIFTGTIKWALQVEVLPTKVARAPGAFNFADDIRVQWMTQAGT